MATDTTNLIKHLLDAKCHNDEAYTHLLAAMRELDELKRMYEGLLKSDPRQVPPMGNVRQEPL